MRYISGGDRASLSALPLVKRNEFRESLTRNPVEFLDLCTFALRNYSEKQTRSLGESSSSTNMKWTRKDEGLWLWKSKKQLNKRVQFPLGWSKFLSSLFLRFFFPFFFLPLMSVLEWYPARSITEETRWLWRM